MSAVFPQYAKSTAPEVIEACEDMLKSYRRLLDYAVEVSKETTGAENRAVIRGSAIDGARVVGLVAHTKEDYDSFPGRWKKWYGAGYQHPFRNNPIQDEWSENRHRRPDIPGRPGMAMGHGYMGPGAIFVHEGIAYSAFGFQPEGEPASDLWEEIKASEWHAAKEAYEDSQKVKS